jgi:hypothetical protein
MLEAKTVLGDFDSRETYAIYLAPTKVSRLSMLFRGYISLIATGVMQ